MGRLGGGVGKVCYSLFATNINLRILNEEDDLDFGENQNHIPVQLHNDEIIKYGDYIMIFLIDVNRFCQHASTGVWIRYNDLYGNPGVLKKAHGQEH